MIDTNIVCWLRVVAKLWLNSYPVFLCFVTICFGRDVLTHPSSHLFAILCWKSIRCANFLPSSNAIRYASCVSYLFWFTISHSKWHRHRPAKKRTLYKIEVGQCPPLCAPLPPDNNTMWISLLEPWSNLEQMHLRLRRQEEKEPRC